MGKHQGQHEHARSFERSAPGRKYEKTDALTHTCARTFRNFMSTQTSPPATYFDLSRITPSRASRRLACGVMRDRSDHRRLGKGLML
eukprot:748824-Pleurochrysis_carterae.AAC.1